MKRRHQRDNSTSNVVPFNRYQRSKSGTNKSQRNRQPRKWLVMVCLACVGLSSSYFYHALTQKNEYQEKLEVAKRQKREARNRLEAKEIEYQHALSPEYLEQVARRDYYYSKPGEIVFDLPRSSFQEDLDE